MKKHKILVVDRETLVGLMRETKDEVGNQVVPMPTLQHPGRRFIKTKKGLSFGALGTGYWDFSED